MKGSRRFLLFAFLTFAFMLGFSPRGECGPASAQLEIRAFKRLLTYKLLRLGPSPLGDQHSANKREWEDDRRE
jgi:hypothetical protein